MMVNAKEIYADVSVVIPCFRCKGTIQRAVASVAAQTLRPAEVILIDDNSDDGTSYVLDAIQQFYPNGWIKVIHQPINKGPGSARNTGWSIATHSYIAFLDSDDAWHPQKVEIQWTWMTMNPDVVLTGHAYEVVDAYPTNAKIPADRVKFTPVSSLKLLLANRFSTPTVMVKRDVPYRFIEGKRACEDFMLWCEILLNGNRCARSGFPLAGLFKAAYGKGGLSGNLWDMEKGELDAYSRLRREGLISAPVMLGLCIWSLIKYLKRIII